MFRAASSWEAGKHPEQGGEQRIRGLCTAEAALTFAGVQQSSRLRVRGTQEQVSWEKI